MLHVYYVIICDSKLAGDGKISKAPRVSPGAEKDGVRRFADVDEMNASDAYHGKRRGRQEANRMYEEYGASLHPFYLVSFVRYNKRDHLYDLRSSKSVALHDFSLNLQ